MFKERDIGNIFSRGQKVEIRSGWWPWSTVLWRGTVLGCSGELPFLYFVEGEDGKQLWCSQHKMMVTRK